MMHGEALEFQLEVFLSLSGNQSPNASYVRERQDWQLYGGHFDYHGKEWEV